MGVIAGDRHPPGRSTKIVCTLGPASDSPEGISGLVAAGMDVARLNLSHGRHDDHTAAYRRVRSASDEAGRAVGVLADLQGPKLRLERLEGGMLTLGDGDALVLGRPGSTPAAEGCVPASAEVLAQELRPGDTVLLRDGAVELEVVASAAQQVQCRVVRGGTIRDHSGVNLPGVPVRLRTLTDKDLDDLRFVLELGVDMVALSFVRRAEDAEAVRAVMDGLGTRVPVLAKIERPEAVERLEEIVHAFDGIMVARGDLGVETALECVPFIQKRAVALARRQAKPVIVATEMLESMVERSRPTRAEVSDVANAMLDGADALMLSAETSIGRHPVAAVTTMARVLSASESWSGPASALPVDRGRTPRGEAVAFGAVAVAQAVGAKALVAFTRTGYSARLLAAQRPTLPVLAFTPTPGVRSQLALVWGVEAFLEPVPGDSDEMIVQVERATLGLGRAEPGDLVVVVAGTPPGVEGTTNMLRVHRLGRE
jgi:pyruvate kinase